MYQPTTGGMMARGPMITRDAPNDEGHDENAIAAALKAKQDRDAAEAEAARLAAEKDKNKPTDAEAALLKDVMKHKKAAETAKTELEKAAARLKEFDGVDPAELRQLLAEKQEAQKAKEDADRAAAEKRGEYDRIIAEVRDQASKREKALADEHTATKSQLEAAQRRIDDLTVGYSFTNSKFLGDETVLSGEKARRLYGDHFEIEDGQVVAYDKPRGSSERTPLVDGKGERLSFEAAIEKIVRADSDFERIAKSKMRPGSNSQQSSSDRNTQHAKTPVLQGRSLMSAALKARAAGRK